MLTLNSRLLSLADRQKEKAVKALADGRKNDAAYHLGQAEKYIAAASLEPAAL